MPVKEPIDEKHPNVSALVEADYTVEQSIDALSKCGTLEAALDYLGTMSASEDEESDEQMDLIPSAGCQFSHDEDPQQNKFGLDW